MSAGISRIPFLPATGAATKAAERASGGSTGPSSTHISGDNGLANGVLLCYNKAVTARAEVTAGGEVWIPGLGTSTCAGAQPKKKRSLLLCHLEWKFESWQR